MREKVWKGDKQQEAAQMARSKGQRWEWSVVESVDTNTAEISEDKEEERWRESEQRI